LKNNVLDVKIENSKVLQITSDSLGIGLKNVRRQLELLYAGQHEIRIENEENTYRVHLRLNV